MSANHWFTGLVFLVASSIGLYQTCRWIVPKPEQLMYESCSDKAVFETPHGKHEIKYMTSFVRKTIDQIILEREAPGKPLSAYELFQLHTRLDANNDNVITPEEAERYQVNKPVMISSLQ